MSSSSPYQSRLLQFLSRQSLRVRDKSSQWLRQARTTAVWGAQILLYPAYLLFQSGRFVSRQLQQTVRQQLPLLQARLGRRVPPADAPVKTVLQVAQTLYLETAETLEAQGQSLAISDNHLPQAPTRDVIQAIACLLETRSLVLVTPQNQVLDILTPTQQHKLSQRLIWEISHYYYQRKSLVLPPRQPQALPLPKPGPNLLPPIRVFQQLMGWVQQGSLASSIDLFQESVYQPVLPEPTLWFTPLSLEPTSVPSNFAGAAQSNQQRGRSLAASYLRQSEPWLTLSDLFGAGEELESAEARMLPEPEPVSPTDQPADLVLSSPQRPQMRTVPRQAAELQAPTQTTPPAPITRARSADSIELQHGEPQSIPVATPADWIEAQVQPLGYIKHPLEHLIGWLDQAILWIENRLGQVSQWIRQHWLS